MNNLQNRLRDTRSTENELRGWFRHMIDDDWSDDECRSVLRDLVEVVPLRWLRDEYAHAYLGQTETP